MVTDRRQFLAGLAVALAAPGLATAAAGPRAAAFLGCRRRNGGFEMAVCDAEGADIAAAPLPARGHGGTVSPDGRRLVVFARRPDRFAVVLDASGGEAPRVVHPPEDRHFFGHGFFSPDGERLYATENDFDRARGVLGIYDVRGGYRRIGEIETGGIGPHQVLLMADGRTAVVANGGIETHPDFPRRKLNLATMSPSLSAIDISKGELTGQAALTKELHQLSIRHIADADGEIWFACQYQGAASDLRPLIGVYRPGGGAELLDAPDAVWASMKNYGGSVAASVDAKRVVATSPRGGVAHVWDVASRKVSESWRIGDVCGAAPLGGGFLLSDGQGRLWRDGRLLLRADGVAWDNHLVALGA